MKTKQINQRIEESEIYNKTKQIMDCSENLYILTTFEDTEFLTNSDFFELLSDYSESGGNVRFLIHKEKPMKKLPKLCNMEVKYSNYRSKSRIIAGENGLIMSGYNENHYDSGCMCSTIYSDISMPSNELFSMCDTLWRIN